MPNQWVETSRRGTPISQVAKAVQSALIPDDVVQIPRHLGNPFVWDALVKSPPLHRWKELVPALGSTAAELTAGPAAPGLWARPHSPHRAPTKLAASLRGSLTRLAVLITADLIAFALMRTLVVAVRDQAALGEAVAAGVASVLPPGNLNGWQYAPALLIGLLVTGNYSQGHERRSPRLLFLACALATALPLWMMIWTHGVEPVVVQYTVTTVLMWSGLLAERLIVDRVVTRIRPCARVGLETLFVGPGAACMKALGSPAFISDAEFRPIGFVDIALPIAVGAIGHIADFSLLLDSTFPQVVVLCGHIPEDQFQEIVDMALTVGCQVLSVPRSVKAAGVHPTTVWRRGQPLVQLVAPVLKGRQLALKRVLDIGGAVAALIVLSPVFAVLAAAVTLESPGPVFFTQVRVGRGGSRFRIIKFRTMVDGAEGQRDELLSLSLYSDPRLFKVPDDPRMTRLGGLLRRTSLDELPQFLNVLRGEMSLVGPRPPLPSEVVLYEEHHYARFDVKPGITGPWQVSGRNGVTAFEEVIRLETAYIQNWSVWADLHLLFKTIPVVLCMRGAF